MNRTRAIVASYVGVLEYAAVIFIAAGRLAYWQAILYTALALIGATISLALTPAGSDLTERRAEEAGAGVAWDRRLLGLMFLANLVMFVVAGLDSGRFGWSGPVPTWVTVIGVVLMLAGQVIFAVAKRQNAFFSSTVRIQSEHGHAVCDTGPYRIVRHPGYLGMLLSSLAFPLVLNSWWAFVPGVVGAALLVARTVLEDRYLTAELPGYAEYAQRTKKRLIPGVF